MEEFPTRAATRPSQAELHYKNAMYEYVVELGDLDVRHDHEEEREDRDKEARTKGRSEHSVPDRQDKLLLVRHGF